MFYLVCSLKEGDPTRFIVVLTHAPLSTCIPLCGSTADIVTNLHAAVTKTECQRAVNSLVDKELLTSKTFGKQTIYVVRQVPSYNPLISGELNAVSFYPPLV